MGSKKSSSRSRSRSKLHKSRSIERQPKGKRRKGRSCSRLNEKVDPKICQRGGGEAAQETKAKERGVEAEKEEEEGEEKGPLLLQPFIFRLRTRRPNPQKKVEGEEGSKENCRRKCWPGQGLVELKK